MANPGACSWSRSPLCLVGRVSCSHGIVAPFALWEAVFTLSGALPRGFGLAAHTPLACALARRLLQLWDAFSFTSFAPLSACLLWACLLILPARAWVLAALLRFGVRGGFHLEWCSAAWSGLLPGHPLPRVDSPGISCSYGMLVHLLVASLSSSLVFSAWALVSPRTWFACSPPRRLQLLAASLIAHLSRCLLGPG